MKTNKPLLYGIIASACLLFFYFAVMALTNPIAAIPASLASVWYWVAILAAGFGLHFGLFVYARQKLSEKRKSLVAEVSASGGVSAGAMVACCSHNVAAFLPLIGLSGLAAFLVRFYVPLILTGILGNLVGITIVLANIERHKLYDEGTFFSRLFGFDMRMVRAAAITLFFISVPGAFILYSAQGSGIPAAEGIKPIALMEKSEERNGLTISVKPETPASGKLMRFFVAFNAHSGDLGFDTLETTLLRDDAGNAYEPLSWDGSASGGHHRSGFIVFQDVQSRTKKIDLVFLGLYGIPERVFTWNIE